MTYSKNCIVKTSKFIINKRKKSNIMGNRIALCKKT